MSSTSYDAVNKIWSGAKDPSPLFHENTSSGRVILHLLSLKSDLICQINADDGSKRTNGEIRKATLKIAINLRKNGCLQGDVVGFVCKNSHDLTPAFLATLFLGTPGNVLDVCFTKDNIVHMFRTTKPKFVFCDDEVAKTIEEALVELNNNAKIIVLGEKIQHLDHISDYLRETDPAEIMKMLMNPPEVDNTSCAAIFCTSGSTGLSKGIAMTQGAVKHFSTFLSVQDIKANSSIFSSASIYWANGFCSFFVSLLLGLQRIFTAKPFNPELTINIIRKYEVNFVFSSFIQVSRLADCELIKDSMTSMQRLLMFGNNLSNDLATRIKEHMPNVVLSVCYGLTEGGIIASQRKPAVKNGAGYLEPSVLVKILDDDGKKLGVGQSGEICVKIKTLFLGYYNNPEATKNAVDEDGWLHTKDIGYFDEEGILFITGRKNDLLRYNYFHVNPTEMEEILQAHPGILYASVIGIPDGLGNDLVTGVVVRKSGSNVTKEEVIEFVGEKVEGFKKLRGGVFFVEELPMTVSGKINRNKVKEMIVDILSKK